MLSRILAGLSIASLLVGLIVLIFWGRSYHHVDHIKLGPNEFTTEHGALMVTISQNQSDNIFRRTDRYAFTRIAGGCLVIPIFWFAIWIRSKLPRPPGRQRDDYLPPLDSSRR
jgi:hypothetical protein